MKLVIRDLAAREILAAPRYYRDAAGPRFRKALVDEIGRAFERVLETPTGFPFCDDEELVRSVLLESASQLPSVAGVVFRLPPCEEEHERVSRLGQT